MSDQHIPLRLSSTYCLLNVFLGLGQWHWIPFCIVTLVCLIPVSNAIPASTKQINMEIDNVIHRLNYGTLFKSMGNLHLSREYWYQTFKIPIPGQISVPKGFSINKQSCSHHNCNFFQSLLTQIHKIQVETYQHVNKTLNFFRSVIPYHKKAPKRRTRSLLPFVGSLSKSLFGTATMEDVNILASHINSLTKTSMNVINALQKQNGQMTSFMATSNKRMDNLQSGISNNFKAISTLSKTFFIDLQHLQIVIENTTEILINQIDLASQLRSNFDNLHNSILALIQGKLTPFFISKTTLHHAIVEITKILADKEPKFYLTQTQVNWYYQYAKYFYARHKNSLFITVKFPLTSQKEPMNIYKVISYPVPINSTSSHGTSLLHLPQYFAVTSHQQFYTTFTVAELETCQQESTMTQCTFNKALTPVTTPSCIIGLFANHKQWIKDFCNFRFLENVINSDIIELSKTSVLAYNAWNIEMNCPNKQELLPGCKFCILNVPCRCTLTTKDLFYSPKLVNCHKSLENITIAHPVNLALLQEFFNDTTLKSIFGDSTFLNPIQVNLPDFKMYTHSYNQFLAADQKAHLNLSKMVQVAKKDQVIFKSLAEPLLEGNIEISSSWPNTSDILNIVAIGLAILAIFGVIFTIFKVRKLLVIITVLQQVNSAKSEPLPSFIYKTLQSTTPPPSEFDLMLENFSWNHASVLISSLVICMLLVIVLKQCYSKRKLQCTQIVFELTNGGECVLIPVLSLPLCPSFWKLVPPSEIHEISVHFSLFSSKMFINWTGFSVTNIKGTRTINVKTEIKLDVFTAYKAKRITQQPFDAHILVSHHGLYQPLPHFGTFIIDAMNMKQHSL